MNLNHGGTEAQMNSDFTTKARRREEHGARVCDPQQLEQARRIRLIPCRLVCHIAVGHRPALRSRIERLVTFCQVLSDFVTPHPLVGVGEKARINVSTEKVRDSSPRPLRRVFNTF